MPLGNSQLPDTAWVIGQGRRDGKALVRLAQQGVNASRTGKPNSAYPSPGSPK